MNIYVHLDSSIPSQYAKDAFAAFKVAIESQVAYKDGVTYHFSPAIIVGSVYSAFLSVFGGNQAERWVICQDATKPSFAQYKFEYTDWMEEYETSSEEQQ